MSDGREGGRKCRPILICLSSQPVPNLNTESLVSLCLTQVHRAGGDLGSSGAGGARNVGVTVNFSKKTLRRVLCASVRRHAGAQSTVGPEDFAEQLLASGNLASETLGAAADVPRSGNPSAGIKKALNRYRSGIKALSSPVDPPKCL